MDLSNPIRSVIPSVQGDVLAVLARTEAPLTGRGISGLIDGVSPSGVKLALRTLTDAGLVLVESHPPANLYRLNRRHLAAHAITALASLRAQLVTAMRDNITSWDPAPWGAWLFGSAARGDGSTASDIDVLVVRPDALDEEDPHWTAQLDRLTDDVVAWTGNPCVIIEYSRTQFDDLLASTERLAGDIRTDGIALTSRRIPRRVTAGSRA